MYDINVEMWIRCVDKLWIKVMFFNPSLTQSALGVISNILFPSSRNKGKIII